MQILLLCGPAFSGKTSLSRALEARGLGRISLDDILRNGGLEPGEGLSAHDWENASLAACSRIRAAASRAQSVVLDDTLCFRFLRNRYREVAEQMSMSARLVVLAIRAEDVRARVAANHQSTERPGLPSDVLEAHLASFEWPGADEPHLELDAMRPLADHLARLEKDGSGS